MAAAVGGSVGTAGGRVTGGGTGGRQVSDPTTMCAPVRVCVCVCGARASVCI